MKRYAAFLRGVSPMNARMPELKRAFERAGFEDVKTLLASGNVIFSAPAGARAALERKVEAALVKYLERPFPAMVRSLDELRRMLAADPFTAFALKPGSKPVVTFLRKPPKQPPELPIALHDARILLLDKTEAFSVYISGPQGPVFMTLIEKTFGKDVTTRTWGTIAKAAK